MIKMVGEWSWRQTRLYNEEGRGVVLHTPINPALETFFDFWLNHIRRIVITFYDFMTTKSIFSKVLDGRPIACPGLISYKILKSVILLCYYFVSMENLDFALILSRRGALTKPYHGGVFLHTPPNFWIANDKDLKFCTVVSLHEWFWKIAQDTLII